MQALHVLALGRNNNLQLIRILAAWAVLFTHSFAISLGSDAAEPGRTGIALTPGDVAVDVFFIISGFLVTGSLLSRESLLDYAWSRILRIYPALIVMTLVVVFVLGPLMTSLGLREYFGSPLTAIFLVKNVSVFFGIGHRLPGVFEQVPYEREVNASLWTLFHEVTMYALLAVFWLLSGWVGRALGLDRRRFFRLAVGAIAVAAALIYVGLHLMEPGWRPFARLFFLFFAGSAVRLNSRRVRLSWPACAAVGAVIVLALPWPRLFFVLYTLGLPYLVFCLAYLPSAAMRSYNRFGDYSYGLYIFAYPVQQTIVACHPGIAPGPLILVATVLTLPLAVLSWNLLEKPALSQKRRAIDWTHAVLGRPRSLQHGVPPAGRGPQTAVSGSRADELGVPAERSHVASWEHAE